MDTIDTTEYSVCEDCLLAIAHDDQGCSAAHNITDAIQRELGERTGHFCAGVEPTEDDPDGAGYEEFSSQDCELCRSSLAGSRHGATLVITDSAKEA